MTNAITLRVLNSKKTHRNDFLKVYGMGGYYTQAIVMALNNSFYFNNLKT